MWKFAVECPECAAYVEVADAPDGAASKINSPPKIVVASSCPRCGHKWECHAGAAFAVTADRCASEGEDAK